MGVTPRPVMLHGGGLAARVLRSLSRFSASVTRTSAFDFWLTSASMVRWIWMGSRYFALGFGAALEVPSRSLSEAPIQLVVL